MKFISIILFLGSVSFAAETVQPKRIYVEGAENGTFYLGIVGSSYVKPNQTEIILNSNSTSTVGPCRILFSPANYTRRFESKNISIKEFYFEPPHANFTVDELKAILLELGATPEVVNKTSNEQELLVMIGSLGGILEASAKIHLRSSEGFVVSCNVSKEYREAGSFIEDLNHSGVGSQLHFHTSF